MTTLRQLSDFFPFVMPYAPGALAPSVEQALRLAAVEFCQRTKAWRYQTSITTKLGGEIIAAPDYASIHEIESAYFEGSKLQPIGFMELNTPTHEDTGQPQYITQVNADTVRVSPFSEGTLELVLYLKPRVGTDYAARSPYEAQTGNHFNQVPEFLFEHHAQVIAHGALVRLLMLPKQSYSDPNLAMQFGAAFNSAIDSLYHRNIRGQHRASARTKSRYL